MIFSSSLCALPRCLPMIQRHLVFLVNILSFSADDELKSLELAKNSEIQELNSQIRQLEISKSTILTQSNKMRKQQNEIE